MSELRKENSIPDVNGRGELRLIQQQLDIHDDYLKRIDSKLDTLIPDVAAVKEKATTNRWLIGLMIVAFLTLAGGVVLTVF